MVAVCPPPKLLLCSQFTIFRLSALVAINFESDIAINTPSTYYIIGAALVRWNDIGNTNNVCKKSVYCNFKLNVLLRVLASKLFKKCSVWNPMFGFTLTLNPNLYSGSCSMVWLNRTLNIMFGSGSNIVCEVRNLGGQSSKCMQPVAVPLVD